MAGHVWYKCQEISQCAASDGLRVGSPRWVLPAGGSPPVESNLKIRIGHIDEERRERNPPTLAFGWPLLVEPPPPVESPTGRSLTDEERREESADVGPRIPDAPVRAPLLQQGGGSRRNMGKAAGPLESSERPLLTPASSTTRLQSAAAIYTFRNA